jgi:putative membrane protein
MKDSPYARFENKELILRDELAIDRTFLANERTLLAYLRSGVSLLIAGVSIMHFATEGWFWNVGIACIPAGVIAAVVGTLRYRSMNSGILKVRRQIAAAARDAEPGD